MRAIMESAFDIFYLIFVTSMGFYLIKKNEKGSNGRLFGIMAVVLGLGDAFHLVPRIFALNTENGFDVYVKALGFGKAVTSITMTIFYIILYYIWKNRYNIKNSKGLDFTIWGLSIVRIIIGLLPQNQWLEKVQPLDFAIYRNIPFAIMGIILIYLFNRETKKHNDKVFKNMGLAIILSFGFYIPVVLFGDLNPTIGLLMIPKTLAYVWVVVMGYNDYKLNNK